MSFNENLVPAIVLDVGAKLESPDVGETERMALLQRLESIKQYCEMSLERERFRARTRAAQRR